MIIANIGGTRLTLQSLKDAEVLLQIFERASFIETEYIDGERFENLLVETHQADLTISITNAKVITRAEADAKRAAAASYRAKKAETTEVAA